jgi:putative sigma-54 modulation protein
MSSNSHGARDNQPAPSFSVEIRSPHFALTPALKTYAARHLAAKLLKHSGHIQAVIVRFDDVNGTKGGEDKVCRVELLMPGEPARVIEEVNHDLRAAIDLAADRVEMLVEAEIQRRRDEPLERGRRLVRYLKWLH